MRTPKRLVAVLGVVFAVYVALGSVSHAFPDFLDHVHAAGEIAAGRMLYRDHVAFINVYHYPPVYLYSLGGVFAVLDAVGLLGSVGAERLAAKAFVALATVAAALVLFHLADRLAGRRRAWLATGLFLANPVTLVGVYGGYFDAFVALFVLLSLLLVARDRPWLAGAALALGVMSKPIPAVFGPVVAAYYLRGWPGDEARERGWLRSLLGHEGFRDLLRFGVAGLAVVVAVSAPFLVLAPEAYVRYAFVYNFARGAGSLGLYFYFLPWLTGTPATTLLPATYLLWVGGALWRSDPPAARVLVDGAGVAVLGFLLLNRINYPHYLVYLAPFLSVVLAREYDGGRTLRGVAAWKPILAAFGGVLAGAGLWAYPWRIGIEGFRSHPLFWIGAGTYFLAAFALLGLLGAVLDEEDPWLLVTVG